MSRKGQEFRRGLAYAALCVGLTGTSAVAWAQDAAPDAGATESDVVVTGSRIRSPNLEQSTPVQTVTGEQLQQRGMVNLADAIKTITSVGPTALAPSAAPRDTINLGLFSVDLRALGSSRTLVLVNGRRHVAGLPGTSIVDLNTIPVDLISRVEVTTGGASAVYGSDAVAGVVNVVLQDKFDGLQLRAQYGISERGDGQQFKVSLLGGGSFMDGRGSATIFASYDKNDDVHAKDRAISRDLIAVTDFTQPFAALRGPAAFSAASTIPGVFGLNGNTVGGATIRRTVLPDGTVTTPSGPRDGLDPQAYVFLLNPNERFLLGGNLRFELDDRLSLFVDTAFSRAEVLQQFEPTFIRTGTLNVGGAGPNAVPLTIPVNNPFIPAAMRALIPAGRTVISIQRSFPEFGPRQTDHVRNLYRIVAGLEGTLPVFGSDWSWEAYYQYGRTTQDQLFRNGINTLNLFQALRVEPNGAGGFRCADAAARATGCIPVNLFTGNPLTAAERAYIGASATVDAENTQQVAAFSVSGELFRLPAGAVSIAFGGEWRREGSSYRPSELLAGGLISLQNVGPTIGRFDVKEAFVEARVPLLSDIPGIDHLEVEGAFRYADYSTSGGVEAWKVGGTYRPFRDLRFRSILARSVRAPNIGELFQGAASSIVGVLDPCAGGGDTPARQANCRNFPGITPGFTPPFPSPVLITFGGNANLQPEIAKTWTAGGVFTPSFLPGAALSVDYFRIKIDNGVGGLGVQQAADLCADTGLADFCSLVTRDPASGILTNFAAQTINIAQEKMTGLDIELSYNRRLFTADDRVSAILNVSRLFEYKITSFPGADPFEAVGSPVYPKFRANLRLSYDRGGFNIAGNLRYIGKAFRAVGEVFDDNEVSPVVYADAQLRYTFDKRHSLYVGANNLLDKDPPFFPLPYFGAASGPNTASATYDVIGRFLYAGASVRF